jgi:hypothetical protein
LGPGCLYRLFWESLFRLLLLSLIRDEIGIDSKGFLLLFVFAVSEESCWFCCETDLVRLCPWEIVSFVIIRYLQFFVHVFVYFSLWETAERFHSLPSTCLTRLTRLTRLTLLCCKVWMCCETFAKHRVSTRSCRCLRLLYSAASFYIVEHKLAEMLTVCWTTIRFRHAAFFDWSGDLVQILLKSYHPVWSLIISCSFLLNFQVGLANIRVRQVNLTLFLSHLVQLLSWKLGVTRHFRQQGSFKWLIMFLLILIASRVTQWVSTLCNFCIRLPHLLIPRVTDSRL